MPRKHKNRANFIYENIGIQKCKSKKAFFSQNEAIKQIELLEIQNNKLNYKSYQCDYCNKWHITSVKSIFG